MMAWNRAVSEAAIHVSPAVTRSAPMLHKGYPFHDSDVHQSSPQTSSRISCTSVLRLLLPIDSATPNFTPGSISIAELQTYPCPAWSSTKMVRCDLGAVLLVQRNFLAHTSSFRTVFNPVLQWLEDVPRSHLRLAS